MARRLFVGIPVPPPIQKGLESYIRALPQDNIRFVKPENYHITLSFLGEQEETKISQIHAAISAISSTAAPLHLSFDTISFAPPNKPPSMIWAKYKENEALHNLTVQIEKAINGVVTYKDKRGDHVLVPHITLARFKHATIDALPQIVLDGILVASISLFESKLTENGPIYTELEKFPLGEASVS